MDLRDVTLREGAQMPGREYTVQQRVDAGRALDRLGIEAIQAGFPAVGENHSKAVRQVASETDATVSALARAHPDDIDAALAAEPDAVDLFASVSEMMLEHVFSQSREEVWEMLDQSVQQVEDTGISVRLGLMDGFRTEPEYIVETAERFPSLSLGLADTIGNRTPSFVRSFLSEIENEGVDLARLGVHFHEDLGVSTANTLVAAEMGAGWADVSVGALGERAGNTPIEQLVVAGQMDRGTSFGIDTSELIPACHDVLDRLGEDISPRRPVIGEEPVRHESGLHTAVMLEEPSVFEPFDPAKFGGRRELVFGSLSGGGAARALLERVDTESTEDRIDRLLTELAEEGPVDLETALDLARDIDS